MKLWIASILLFAAIRALAYDENRLANAIYRAEGGKQASVPYGITTVKVQSAWQARSICLRMIRRAKATWDGRGDFIAHLGQTYCPPSADPRGHRNWVRNVRSIYASAR